MTDQHPIVPSFEMANQWHKEACKDPYNGGKFIESKTLMYITTKAAQWGSDQELEDCCKWVSLNCPYFGDYPMPEDRLRDARRPKPPNLKEQALAELEEIMTELHDETGSAFTASAIRKALEALPND